MANNKARLDMRHGFMKSIIRNQVDRDNYDKEVKAQQATHKQKPSKTKKPDQQTYVPSPKRQQDNDADNSVLFQFKFEDQHGTIHSMNVFKQTNPAEMARKLSRETHLTGPMIKALEDFLDAEMQKVDDVS